MGAVHNATETVLDDFADIGVTNGTRDAVSCWRRGRADEPGDPANEAGPSMARLFDVISDLHDTAGALPPQSIQKSIRIGALPEACPIIEGFATD